MPSNSRRTADAARSRRRGDLVALILVGLLLWAVGFLPPDTTLKQVRESGVLRVCVPDRYPPLVTQEADMPGIDIEIMREVSADLGVRLLLVQNSAIGRDINPRNWRITRAQCLIIAGGVVDTASTRGFLMVTSPHIETGWAAATLGEPPLSIEGLQIGFFAGLTGLDRLALSRWLRARGASVTVLSSRAAAAEGLVTGALDVVATEALTAGSLAGELGGRAVWLSRPEERVKLGFGMWKGDLTLERAVERALRSIVRDGRLDELLSRYGLVEIEEECDFCS